LINDKAKMTKKRSIRNLILKILPQEESKVPPLSDKEREELKERILKEIKKKTCC
jgi:hypothetical protein